MAPIILASASSIRAELLRRTRVPIEVVPSDIDETAIKSTLVKYGSSSAEMAITLAEAKATNVSARHLRGTIIGCDQIMELNGRILSKPDSRGTAIEQLCAMSGETHRLVLGTVVVDQGHTVWQHSAEVTLTLRNLSHSFIERYVARNWESIRHAVGAYKLEDEGARLFRRIDGDYFHVLGLPLLELISYFEDRGILSE